VSTVVLDGTKEPSAAFTFTGSTDIWVVFDPSAFWKVFWNSCRAMTFEVFASKPFNVAVGVGWAGVKRKGLALAVVFAGVARSWKSPAGTVLRGVATGVLLSDAVFAGRLDPGLSGSNLLVAGEAAAGPARVTASTTETIMANKMDA
jgi:hypothetical protein